MHFTHLECTIQWLFIYSQICTTLTTITFRTFYRSQKESLSPLAVYLPTT